MLGLEVALEEVDDGGGKQEQHHHQQERTEQRAPFMRNHPLQRLQRRRVPDELQQSELAQHPQDPQVHGYEGMQVPGQNRKQVDDHHRPHCEFGPCAPGGRRRNSGMSTELHSRKTYSMVKTITEKVLKASSSDP
jgi:hypothetical protein